MTCQRDQGDKGVCGYLLNYNNSIDDMSAINLLEDSFKTSNNYIAEDRLQGLLIVHVRFVSPKVEMTALDARLTYYDKIEDLGGIAN